MPATSRDELYGIEFDWFAVDRDGHPAVFFSAGFGPIPQLAVESQEAQHRLSVLLEGAGTRAIQNLDGSPDTMAGFATHGLYCYDWNHWDGPYRLIAKPKDPVLPRELAPAYAEIIQKVRFTGLCFVRESAVRPEDHLPC